MLYYVTPKQYRAVVLDQQQYDPKAMENLNKEEALEELLLKCSLSELISTLIMIFKESMQILYLFIQELSTTKWIPYFFLKECTHLLLCPYADRPTGSVLLPYLHLNKMLKAGCTADFGKEKTGICADPATGLKCKLPEFCTRY